MDPHVLLAGLDESQRRAVTSTAQPLCILAGAGSGKTRVLTRRIAHRAATHDADPRHVLALTFTRKAADELGSRLAALGLRDLPTSGTFHGVAWAQLNVWWRGQGRAAPTLLDRKASLLGPLLGRTARMRPVDVATEIEWARARLVPPEQYASAARDAGRRTGLPAERVADMYAAYEARKRERGVVDFDDLLERCAEALESDAGFAEAQRWRFRHLFVDEYQDVNALQHRLLTAWLGERTDLCVVGDPNQAIYRWNGADARFLLRFDRLHPGGETIRLTGNYRSSPEILAVAAAVLHGGESPAPIQEAHRPSGAVPAVVAYPTDADEARGIARAVRDNHRPGSRWDRQAVLVRTNGQAAGIEQALGQARIPHRVRGAVPFLRRPEVLKALDALGRSRGSLAGALAAVEPEPVDEGALTDHDRDARQSLVELVRLGHEFLSIEPSGTGSELRWWLAATLATQEHGARGSDAVEIVTFHAAKGLEWPVVHLAGLEAGFVPVSHARSDEELEEERRLLYVAVTRAEEVLRCTWAEQRTFGERVSPRSPSPYLADMASATARLRARSADVDHDRGLARARARLEVRHTTTGHAELLHALHTWRDRVARSAGTAPAVVLSDLTLEEIAERRPRSPGELDGIADLGPIKRDEYGTTLLGLVAEHAHTDARTDEAH